MEASNGSTQVNATVTINLNNLNDNPPVFTAAGPFTIAADAANGTIVGNINGNDGDLGSNDRGLTYSITGGSGMDAFTISSTSGSISVLDASLLVGSSLTLEIQVDDGLFQSTTTVTVNIGSGNGGDFVINQGISASWFNASTSGQGFLFDVEPVSQFMFVAWFTFDDTVAKVGSPDNRWLVASGNYAGDTATLQLFKVSGGLFNDPRTVEQVSNGTLTISFSDCENGLVDYDLPDDGLMGQIEIVRAVPGTQTLCQSLLAANKRYEELIAGGGEPASVTRDQAPTVAGANSVGEDQQIEPSGVFEINQGISAAWFEPATSGQGFLFDVEPATQFIFMAWFTFDDEASVKVGAAEQRWLVASGNYTGNLADLDLFAVSGGLFDDPQGVTSTLAGSVTVAFSGCENGIVEFDLPDEGLAGQIPIVRAVPGTESLCQTLASGKQKE